MNGEGEHGSENLEITVSLRGGDQVDPTADRQLVVPAEAIPAQYAEVTDDPDRTGRMALDNCGFEYVGQYHQVPLRAGGAIEHHPLGCAVGPPQDPARQSIGEAAGGRKGLLVQRLPGDVELGSRSPTRPDRTSGPGLCHCSQSGVRAQVGGEPDRSPRPESPGRRHPL